MGAEVDVPHCYPSRALCQEVESIVFGFKKLITLLLLIDQFVFAEQYSAILGSLLNVPVFLMKEMIYFHLSCPTSRAFKSWAPMLTHCIAEHCARWW